MRNRLVGLVALLGLILAGCGGGAPETADPTEGIQVHGDWTIDIYDTDGTLDQHVQFSNGLTANGAELLTTLIARQTAIGVWGISLEESPTTDLCPSQADGDCWIPLPGQVTLEDLDGDSSNETLRLAGSQDMEVDGTIASVRTNVGTCAVDTPPNACFQADRNNVFTIKDVTALDWDGDGTPNDGPIPVSAGQAVQVQVEISFTSG
jgi:hypothetical protein